MAALSCIIADYNNRYATNHTIAEFDAYYQDVQQRIKSQKFSDADTPGISGPDTTADLPGGGKLDLVIVDMLLTGFDSKLLNTLYVDENLKHHGLIQAFSRTNRVLNDTRPHGQILDLRGQQQNVDDAIHLFAGLGTTGDASGGDAAEASREIWLVESAPVVIHKLKAARQQLDDFFRGQDLEPTPSNDANLKGDHARAGFIEQYKQVQKLSTQLEQYTDLPTSRNRRSRQPCPRTPPAGSKAPTLTPPDSSRTCKEPRTK